MIDVGRRIGTLPPVVAVMVSGEAQSTEKKRKVVHVTIHGVRFREDIFLELSSV
jgi:hypothetical protein